MIKNAFYFNLKALFIILRYLNFCTDFYGDVRKQLDKKTKVNFKFMTSKIGKQINKKTILPNISRSKGNCTIQFSNEAERLVPDRFFIF